MKETLLSLLVLASVFILGGCSSSYYSRPDTTYAERNEDYRYCEGVALSDYPERNVKVKSDTTTSTCTTDKGGKTTCISKENYYETDENRSSRDRAELSCMRLKGYKHIRDN